MTTLAVDAIPVFTPTLCESDRAALLAAFDSGHVTMGARVAEFESLFAHYCRANHGIAVSSGTTALHIATTLADLRPGDEVLVSALTNIATANAVAQCGGTIVPVDSEPDTWNMDVALVPSLTTARTRAAIPVHIYGHPVDMGALIAALPLCVIIEDAAEAHGATYRDTPVGAIGDIGCFSFYGNKVITTGEGGMLVTNDAYLADRCRLLRNLAFTLPRFLHQERGYNYRMTDLQGALGCSQMRRIDGIVERKRNLARRYTERLAHIPWLSLPVERPWAKNIYWMYCIVAATPLIRDRIVERLADNHIETRTMFCPLNIQPALRGYIKHIACPVAEHLWQTGLYLPSDPYLTDSQLDRICEIVACSA